MTAQSFSSDPVRKIESVWRRIAHERVKERLEKVFFGVGFPFFGVSRDPSRNAYEQYSEQVRRLQNTTSKVASRELENAVRVLEDTVIQQAFGIYQEEAPESLIKCEELLWAIYNFGLVPFIETQVLIDICHRLDRAQPSAGLNLFRPDGHRFFTYTSEGLRNEFPIVIRIVDELKSQWCDKMLELTANIKAPSLAMSSSGAPNDGPEHFEAPAKPKFQIGQFPPDWHPAQSPCQASSESAPTQSDDDLSKGVHGLQESLERTVLPANQGETVQKALSPTSTSSILKWQDIEIRFLSDDRVQIHILKKPGETLNYAEFGFENSKTGNPNAAWIALRQIALKNGIIRNESEAGVRWTKFEKRVQEIRKVLRKRFDVWSDPIPYVEGTGYRTLFNISCAPAFRR